MAIRGKYSKDEEKMLADFKLAAENMSGWAKTLRTTVVTEEALKSIALAVDPWNPLWQDNGYAARSRWGGLCVWLMTWLRPSSSGWSRWYELSNSVPSARVPR